jgi:predicted glycosyltransferase
VKKIIADNKIDVVISDNRYGLYTKGIPSVIITHQLKIIFPKPFKWAMSIGVRFIKRYAERYTECWIPDNREGFRISGELSQPNILPKNAEFIGLLSRFGQYDIQKTENPWDLVGIVSGPPPHRDIFEKELVNLSNRLGLKALIIQGLPEDLPATKEMGSVTLVPHLPDHEMAEAMVSAKYLICRSGYSTIMDLITLKRSAMLVPTPGQTEQEYLANYLSANKLFVSCHQGDLQKIEISKFKEIGFFHLATLDSIQL